MLYSYIHRIKKSHNQGAATLVMALVLMIISALMVIYAAQIGVMQSRSIANITRNEQAFEAAQAGLEYGINYLQSNSTTILASPVAGFIAPFSNVNTSNVTLANNSKYTFVYSNPVAYNYILIQITSTGVSNDGTSTRVVSQLLEFGSLLQNPPPNDVTATGAVTTEGVDTITNLTNNSTIHSGGSTVFTGSGHTVLSSGVSSSAGNIKSDVTQNDVALSAMSSSDFFSTYFGQSSATIKSSVAHYYSNSASTNYNATLNGMTGTTIWIDQTGGQATINGTTTIGTAASPVLLIVNGVLELGQNVTIYGFIYSTSSASIGSVGAATINGAMAINGSFDVRGADNITYSPTVLSNLQHLSNSSFYAKVPGSWKDY